MTACGPSGKTAPSPSYHTTSATVVMPVLIEASL